jgi:hypothetical protein
MHTTPALFPLCSALPEPTSMVLLLWRMLERPPEVPFCTLEEGYLRVGETRVELGEKTLMIRLLQGFIDAPQQQMQKEDLIRYLYTSTPLLSLSWRQRTSYTHNTVKLLSRTRKWLQGNFQGKLDHIEWLPYDAASKTWSLWRFSSSVFSFIGESSLGEPGKEGCGETAQLVPH